MTYDIDKILYADDPLSDVRLNPNADYDTATPLLCIDGTRLLTKGNISVIAGPPKTFKSSLASLLAGATLCGGLEYLETDGDDHKVLWIDTEQSPHDCLRVYRRIALVRGLDEYSVQRDLTYIMLREKTPEERIKITQKAIRAESPSLVVIDGVADLIDSNNDERSASVLQDFLLRESSVNDCHICCIIHTNPGSEKPRGHSGSNLLRKAETIMNITKAGEYIEISNITRGKPIPPFHFQIDDNAIPYPCDPPNAKNISPQMLFESILLPKEVIPYTELMGRIKRFRHDMGLPLSDRGCRYVIQSAVKKNIIKRVKTGLTLDLLAQARLKNSIEPPTECV